MSKLELLTGGSYTATAAGMMVIAVPNQFTVHQDL